MYQAEFDFKQREIHISHTQGFNPTGWDGSAWTGEPNDPKDWDGASNTLHSVYSTKNVNLTGLKPDMTYYVRVVDVDKTNQRSEPSDEVQITPTKYNGEEVADVIWDSLHPTLQLVQVMNRDPFIIPEKDGSYGLQLLSETREYKFYPSDDAYIDEDPSLKNRNYGTQNKMIIRNAPALYSGGQQIVDVRHKKAYIRFDFDQSSIPAGEEITDVRLVFYAEGSTRSVVLHRVLSAWQEMSITGKNQPNVAASELVPAFNIASAGFVELVDPAITAWVNAVKSGTKTNYGFRLWTTVEGKDLYIRSKEYRDVSYRPYLYVKTDTGAASGLNLTITPGKFYVRGQVKSLNEPYTFTPPGVPGSRYVVVDLDADGNIVITATTTPSAGALILGRVVQTATEILSVDMSRFTGRKEGGSTAAMFGNDMFKSGWIQIVPGQGQEVTHGLGPGRYGYFLEQQTAEGQPIYTRHMSGSKGVDVQFMPDGKTVRLQGGSTYTMTYLNDNGSEVNVASSRVRITIWKIADS